MADSISFAPRVQRAFILAQREAQTLGHAMLYPAHLLLGVVQEQGEHRRSTRLVSSVPLVWLYHHSTNAPPPRGWPQRQRELVRQLRRAIEQRYGHAGVASAQFGLSAESQQALRTAALAARAQHMLTIALPHLLLGLLDTQASDPQIMTAIEPYMAPIYDVEA